MLGVEAARTQRWAGERYSAEYADPSHLGTGYPALCGFDFGSHAHPPGGGTDVFVRRAPGE